MNKVKIVLRDTNCMPIKKRLNDAGYDLKSMIDTIIAPNSQQLVDTGINILLPHEEGFIWQAQIRPRSGLANKYGITVTNTPGTIDNDYTGDIKVIIRNQGTYPFVINKYDRIAQMVITRNPMVEFEVVEKLQETDRNSLGFGSSGVK